MKTIAVQIGGTRVKCRLRERIGHRRPRVDLWRPGDLTFICRLDDLIRTSTLPLLIIIYMRVSNRKQKRRGNLDNRVKHVKHQLRKRGLDWVTVFREVGDGSDLDRPKFCMAIECARQLQVENPDKLVVILTDTTRRILRGPDHTRTSDVPSVRQCERLRAEGVVFATILDPLATEAEMNSYETSIPKYVGDDTKKVGRPKKTQPTIRPTRGAKKARRLSLLPEVEELYALGHEGREIGRLLRVAESTVRRWLSLVKLSAKSGLRHFARASVTQAREES